ncbi:MAG: hypothetical protein A3E81_01845 [Gammaproteobacteria bacterium RIFCSPHIGHO2_12_FULL_36_30]|nr:MAG: hypothetical protein A3E81_01845 [Gammaproteobacteria bacterium RIFCSPHIGHO2_12_FULL_36_30]
MESNKYKINFKIEYQQWLQYFSSVEKPNLSQSWHYGDAKMKSHRWKIIRAIVSENEKPIALIQVWYKKILFFKFARISYGPLWIIPTPSLEQIQAIFYIIKKQWCLKKLCVLSIAPNLKNSSENNNVLENLGFFKRKGMQYESGLIDLTQSIETLRCNLRQNWRNQLNFAEKKELIFTVSDYDSDFQWLIACFNTFRNEKNFYGHSVKLLRALWQSNTEYQKTNVGFVTHHNEKVAGILIAQSGASCVPLIIWVNKNGRKLNAGNFLLWNSVLYSKKQGTLWFDLGSIINNTFKTGLPHIPFQLIGEYYGFI